MRRAQSGHVLRSQVTLPPSGSIPVRATSSCRAQARMRRELAGSRAARAVANRLAVRHRRDGRRRGRRAGCSSSLPGSRPLPCNQELRDCVELIQQARTHRRGSSWSSLRCSRTAGSRPLRAAAVARWAWTIRTAIAPSPTPVAQRLVDPERTSPTAKTPGRGSRAGCPRLPRLATCAGVPADASAVRPRDPDSTANRDNGPEATHSLRRRSSGRRRSAQRRTR